jgi:hypothetical protein
MKFNLSKNKKFLLSLLVIVIAYCNNINATVCKWDGCVPMSKNLLRQYKKFNEKHSNGDIINQYSEGDLNKLIDCDTWKGQWPKNCPLLLEKSFLWTEDLINIVVRMRNKKGKFPPKCNFFSYNMVKEDFCNNKFNLWVHPFKFGKLALKFDNGNFKIVSNTSAEVNQHSTSFKDKIMFNINSLKDRVIEVYDYLTTNIKYSNDNSLRFFIPIDAFLTPMLFSAIIYNLEALVEQYKSYLLVLNQEDYNSLVSMLKVIFDHFSYFKPGEITLSKLCEQRFSACVKWSRSNIYDGVNVINLVLPPWNQTGHDDMLNWVSSMGNLDYQSDQLNW